MTLPSSQDATVLLTGPLNVEQKERQVCVNNNEGVASAVFHLHLETTCDHLTQLTRRLAFFVLTTF